MNTLWLNAALKGVLEGLTEFLPISSTGHLVLVRDWLPLEMGGAAQTEAFTNMFDVVVQLPAILAILVIFRQRLWKEAIGVVREPAARRFWLGLFAAFLPAAIVGLLTHHKIELYLEKPLPVAGALFVGGLAILAVERWVGEGGDTRAEDVPLRTSLGVGLFQMLSLFPGTSRSAATIIGGRLQKLNRSTAAEYSFFLALPTMFAATFYKLFSSLKGIDWSVGAAPLAIGCVASFVVAYLVVEWFMNFIRKRTLSVFGWYRLALALAIVVVKVC